MISKFHHEEIYRGKSLTEKLNKLLTVCGCGALGGNLTDNLTRQGFSNVRIIDKDRVETHNINTQIFVNKDVGALKVSAASNRIFSAVGVEPDIIPKELTASNIKKSFRHSFLVVDCFDNSLSRMLVQDYCRSNKISCIHMGLYSDYGEVVWDESYKVPEDNDNDVCDYPLARNIVMLVVAVASEEIINFYLDSKIRRNFSITLKDLKIKSYR